MNYVTLAKMTRLGQSNLFLCHSLVGTMWIRDVFADHAVQPRLLLNAGCQVQEVTGRRPPQEDLTGFRIINLGGQLRWESVPDPSSGTSPYPKTLSIFSRQHTPRNTSSQCAVMFLSKS